MATIEIYRYYEWKQSTSLYFENVPKYICCSLFSQINQWWINPSVPFAINSFPKTKKILPSPKKVGLNRFMCLSTDQILDVEFFILVYLRFHSDMVRPVSKSSVFCYYGNQIKITHIFLNVIT